MKRLLFGRNGVRLSKSEAKLSLQSRPVLTVQSFVGNIITPSILYLLLGISKEMDIEAVNPQDFNVTDTAESGLSKACESVDVPLEATDAGAKDLIVQEAAESSIPEKVPFDDDANVEAAQEASVVVPQQDNEKLDGEQYKENSCVELVTVSQQSEDVVTCEHEEVEQHVETVVVSRGIEEDVYNGKENEKLQTKNADDKDKYNEKSAVEPESAEEPALEPAPGDVEAAPSQDADPEAAPSHDADPVEVAPLQDPGDLDAAPSQDADPKEAPLQDSGDLEAAPSQDADDLEAAPSQDADKIDAASASEENVLRDEPSQENDLHASERELEARSVAEAFPSDILASAETDAPEQEVPADEQSDGKKSDFSVKGAPVLPAESSPVSQAAAA